LGEACHAAWRVVCGGVGGSGRGGGVAEGGGWGPLVPLGSSAVEAGAFFSPDLTPSVCNSSGFHSADLQIAAEQPAPAARRRPRRLPRPCSADFSTAGRQTAPRARGLVSGCGHPEPGGDCAPPSPDVPRARASTLSPPTARGVVEMTSRIWARCYARRAMFRGGRRRLVRAFRHAPRRPLRGRRARRRACDRPRGQPSTTPPRQSPPISPSSSPRACAKPSTRSGERRRAGAPPQLVPAWSCGGRSGPARRGTKPPHGRPPVPGRASTASPRLSRSFARSARWSGQASLRRLSRARRCAFGWSLSSRPPPTAPNLTDICPAPPRTAAAQPTAGRPQPRAARPSQSNGSR